MAEKARQIGGPLPSHRHKFRLYCVKFGEPTVTTFRRRLPITRNAVCLAALVLMLAGCGIKSGLEIPQSPTANVVEPAPVAQNVPAKPALEQSSVVGGRAFSLMPPPRPYEWDKEKGELKEKQNPSANRPGSKSTTPDKPFILDSLL